MLPMVLEWAPIRFFLSHCSIEKRTLKAFLFNVYYAALDKTRGRAAREKEPGPDRQPCFFLFLV